MMRYRPQRILILITIIAYCPFQFKSIRAQNIRLSSTQLTSVPCDPQTHKEDGYESQANSPPEGSSGKTNPVEKKTLITVSYEFPTEGWYLISLPVIPMDSQVNILFPSALSGIAFEWLEDQSGYGIVTELEPGKGYWLAISEASTSEVQGQTFYSYTNTYNQGWYLIGSVQGGTDFSDPLDEPDGSILTPCFGWTSPFGPYYTTTYLNEKEAYWIAIYNSCELLIYSQIKTPPSTQLGLSRKWQTFADIFGQHPPPPPFVTNSEAAKCFAPDKIHIYQNYPNPFNSETVIEYDVPDQLFLNIEIFDVNGAKVTTLANELILAGSHRTVWHGVTDSGNDAPSGMYLIRIMLGKQTKILKTILIR